MLALFQNLGINKLEEEENSGHYLLENLKDKKLTKKDVSSFFKYVKTKSKEVSELDFPYEVIPAFAELEEKYKRLNKKSEPSIESLLFYSTIEKDIIRALKKLAGKRNNRADKKIIEAFNQNLQFEKKKYHVENGEIIEDNQHVKEKNLIEDGNLLAHLKVIFRKKLLR